MAEARRMGKSELFSHFAERFEVKRTQAREFFDALTELAEKELKRSGEFVLPGIMTTWARPLRESNSFVISSNAGRGGRRRRPR